MGDWLLYYEWCATYRISWYKTYPCYKSRFFFGLLKTLGIIPLENLIHFMRLEEEEPWQMIEYR